MLDKILKKYKDKATITIYEGANSFRVELKSYDSRSHKIIAIVHSDGSTEYLMTDLLNCPFNLVLIDVKSIEELKSIVKDILYDLKETKHGRI